MWLFTVIGTDSRDLAEVNLLLLDIEFLGGLSLGRPGNKLFSKSFYLVLFPAIRL